MKDHEKSAIAERLRLFKPNKRALQALSQAAIEGQALAVYLLCAHQTNLTILLQSNGTTDPNDPSNPFRFVDPGVFNSVYTAFQDAQVGGPNGELAEVIAQFRLSFKFISLMAMRLDDDPYDDDPDACPSNPTLDSLQNVGLMKVA
jgi:hypothetical protein